MEQPALLHRPSAPWGGSLLPHGALHPRVPRTMSLEEVRRSSLLTGFDVLLFFTSGVVAMRYWLETRARVQELRHLRLDADSLACRGRFLQLLTASNALRALGLVVDAQFRTLFSVHRHRYSHFQHWFDYLVSSLPTLVWCSTLSFLLLYIIEIYYRSQLQKVRLLRPGFAFLNAVSYFLYSAIALITLSLPGPSFQIFRKWLYFPLGCVHVGLSFGIARFGFGLRWQLLRRTEVPSQPKGPSAIMIRRITMLATLVPITELVRTFNDFEYSLGGLPFNLDSGVSSLVFLAMAKLALEWVPSVAILFAFRPEPAGAHQASTAFSKSPACLLVDPLLPPGAETQTIRMLGAVLHEVIFGKRPELQGLAGLGDETPTALQLPDQPKVTAECREYLGRLLGPQERRVTLQEAYNDPFIGPARRPR